jgi:hypothetical protein
MKVLEDSLLYFANNVENSCAIVKELIDTTCTSFDDVLMIQKTAGEAFVVPNQLHWITEDTAHRGIALPFSVLRQIGLGYYLKESSRREYLLHDE